MCRRVGPGFAIGLNSALLAYLMCTSRLIPRTIAVLGMAGGSLVFASSSAVHAGLYEQTSTGAWPSHCRSLAGKSPSPSG
jgi:hypothetical protein